MHRFSFRVTLLLGFLLLAILLGAAALRGLIALEDFAVQSRRSADAAVQVTADLQQLAERTVDLERSARQFLVLRDPALRERFDALVSSMHLGKPPRGHGGSSGHGGGRKPRHLH